MALVTAGLARAQPAALPAPVVLTAALPNDSINPVTARFLVRAIDEAEARSAACVVILLDTPGGLVESTRAITRRILDSRVPVVVYVSPAGGRAASAGLFITVAAHVAAMAPGTNIGAAHPVQAGGSPLGPSGPAPSDAGNATPSAPGSPMEDKILNDTVAWVRSMAELRGRNVGWVERAVTESASITATEAAATGVVDLVAPDLASLLAAIDGRTVAMPGGPVTLRTSGATVEALEMWWGDRLLSALANPNLAFLLLMLGFYGLLFELYTAGWGVGGTVGVICLVLGFFAMAVLPINYVGLALLVIGLGLFVAEAFIVSHGLLAFGGVACVGIGGLMLVDSPPGFMRVSPWLVLPVALASAAVVVFLVGQIVRAHRAPPVTGAESLLGARAVAAGAFTPAGGRWTGLVRVHGEIWRAVGDRPVADGAALAITARDGLTLTVAEAGGPASPGTGEIRHGH
ncbi:MAG: nodulation protein NfeD [Vicinamibacterales bacterium]